MPLWRQAIQFGQRRVEPLGQCDDLRHDLIDKITDRALFRDDEATAPEPDVRTQESFAARARRMISMDDGMIVTDQLRG